MPKQSPPQQPTGTIQQQADQYRTGLLQQVERYQAEAPARAERQRKRKIVLELLPTLKTLLDAGFSPEKMAQFFKANGTPLSASLLRRVLVEEKILPAPQPMKKAAPKKASTKAQANSAPVPVPSPATPAEVKRQSRAVRKRRSDARKLAAAKASTKAQPSS